MKPHLLEIKETEGDEEFYSNIRNCVAGCKLKWKSMHKVCYFTNNISWLKGFLSQDIKTEYFTQAKTKQASYEPAEMGVSVEDNSNSEPNFRDFRNQRKNKSKVSLIILKYSSFYHNIL